MTGYLNSEEYQIQERVRLPKALGFSSSEKVRDKLLCLSLALLPGLQLWWGHFSSSRLIADEFDDNAVNEASMLNWLSPDSSVLKALQHYCGLLRDANVEHWNAVGVRDFPRETTRLRFNPHAYMIGMIWLKCWEGLQRYMFRSDSELVGQTLGFLTKLFTN